MELKLTAGMYSRAQGVSALLLVLLAALVLASSSMPSAMAQSANGVMATYIRFSANTPSVNRDLYAVCASCAALDGAMPLKWRAKYFWTAFCARCHNNYACGMCLQVTNAATGAWTTVRIVDDCSRIDVEDVLAMDTPVFKLIDNDGRGVYNGHLMVNYQFGALTPCAREYMPAVSFSSIGNAWLAGS